METTVQNDPFNNAMQEPARPQLLTVVCILTFVMCGIMFIMGIIGIVNNNPEKMQEKIEQMRSFSPEMADKMEEQMVSMQDSAYQQVAPYLNLLYTLLSLLGAIMMWKLKKTGFYLYLAGELLPYIGFITGGKQAMAMMSSMGGGMAETAGMIALILMLVFDIAFFAMYAVNLKHMK